MPHAVKKRPRVVATVTLDEGIQERIEAIRAAGLALNVSAAARAGIEAELVRLEETAKKLGKR